MEHQLVEGTYKKEPDGKTYLLLSKSRSTYEEDMIRKAMPAGVLSMVKSEREDYYKYEITGRKTLSMTFERVPMNAEQVQKVLKGILTVLEQGAEYLLSEEHFVLQAEHIYLRIPEYEVTLCYYPEYSMPFAEQLGKLFEMLLNRVDYREEAAIALVYSLYMQLQEPDMTIERLKGNLEEQKKKAETKDERKENGERRTAYFEKKELQERTEPTGTPGVSESRGKKKASFLEWFRKEGNARKMLPSERKPLEGEDLRERRSWETMGKGEVPAYVMEPAPEWGMQHTRVLSVKKDTGCPMLVSEQKGETIELKKFPFYIGSLAGYADGVLANDTVSRFHAKLLKEGEEVFVTDLNSTNGTRVNGEILNIQEKVKLSSGDRIAFAEEEYCYFGA